MAEEQYAVELSGITKCYGTVTANDNVTLRVRCGAIHAIVGENGAGKSTLMKILAGVTRPDAGSILINGRAKTFHNPSDAIAAGIGMVFQHFRLVHDFTVAENVMLGLEQGFAVRARDLNRVVGELAEKYHLRIDARAKVATLGVGEQQRVEILKVLHRNAQVIILDEPTAVLTPAEVADFFETVRQLRDAGATVLLITHKLNEVMELCDSVTVLRQGRVVGDVQVSDTSTAELSSLMVGDTDNISLSKSEPTADSFLEQSDGTGVLLRVRGLVPSVERKGSVGRPLSFSLSAGEILGIAGVEGNGQTELVETLMGLRKARTGEIWFRDRDVSRWDIKARRMAGFAYIPEDRQRHGLVLDFTLRENVMLGRQWKETRLPGSFTFRAVKELLQAYDVRPDDPDRRAHELSGGNQQKLVVAREVSRGAPLLLASHPTRGVDIGAARAIYEHLKAQRAAGTAILLVSSDLEEVLSLSDTIMVMFKGAIVFNAPNVHLDEQLLGWYMAGGDSERSGKEAG